MSETAIEIDGVRRAFGSVTAVDGVSLTIGEGEFFSLLGPSGCGKTTLLRMIAGFEHPDAGRILLRGEDVTPLPAHKRAVNTVFQSYELFPHMTVDENVAYGLRLRRTPRAEITSRVAEALELVGVGDLGGRHAGQLSGGQQQRVALARAIVNKPAVLLLDEPLSALDVKLRKRMQTELKAIQHHVGTTFVYVTHDQEEALALSDRIAIMSAGRVLQVAPPRDIYDHPADAFVADFVGSLNEFIVACDTVADGRLTARLGDGGVLVAPATDAAKPGARVRVAVRPERIEIATGPANGASRVAGVVREVVYLGPLTRHVVHTAGAGTMRVDVLSDPGAAVVRAGDDVVLTWNADAAIVLGTAT